MKRSPLNLTYRGAHIWRSHIHCSPHYPGIGADEDTPSYRVDRLPM